MNHSVLLLEKRLDNIIKYTMELEKLMTNNDKIRMTNELNDKTVIKVEYDDPVLCSEYQSTMRLRKDIVLQLINAYQEMYVTVDQHPS